MADNTKEESRTIPFAPSSLQSTSTIPFRNAAEAPDTQGQIQPHCPSPVCSQARDTDFMIADSPCRIFFTSGNLFVSSYARSRCRDNTMQSLFWPASVGSRVPDISQTTRGAEKASNIYKRDSGKCMAAVSPLLLPLGKGYGPVSSGSLLLAKHLSLVLLVMMVLRISLGGEMDKDTRSKSSL